MLVNLNMLHLSPRIETVFEALDDAGLATAAVNTYVIRGRTRHPITRPPARRLARRMGVADAVYGPRRYFLGDLFFSDATGAPINIGSGVDRHSGHVGRWLVTRDGFDFLFFYLYETDAAQHRGGDVIGAVAGADRGLELLVEAAGGRERFLDRYALMVVADHSQSAVTEIADAAAALEGLRIYRGARGERPGESDVALASSNRVSMAYLLPGANGLGRRARRVARCSTRPPTWCSTAATAGSSPSAAAASCGSNAAPVTPTGGATRLPSRAMATCCPKPATPTRSSGSRACSTAPTPGTSWSRPRLGYEFADAGGGHHVGGGSHGSLNAADSLVPLITAGFDVRMQLPEQPSITDLTPLTLRHFGVR